MISTFLHNIYTTLAYRQPEDRFLRQAREDQKRAEHPGCVEGQMDCTSLTCTCDEGCPCEAFVRARAAQLRYTNARTQV